MVASREYAAKGTTHPLRRSYGEAYICEIINMCDKMYKKDASFPGIQADADVQKGDFNDMTFEQKCRIRDDVFRNARQIAREHIQDGTAYSKSTDIDAETYHPFVLEEAFFKSAYGAHFAEAKAKWQSDFNNSVHAALASWTYDGANSSPTRYLVSPYDPLFSDHMKDDNIGYIVINTDANNKPVDDGTLESVYEPTSGKHIYYISSVKTRSYYDAATGQVVNKNNNMIERYSPELVRDLGMYPATPVIAPEDRSGFDILAPYIRDKDKKEVVREALKRQTETEGWGPITNDERMYLKEACAYLAEAGYSFDFDVDKDGPGTLTIALSSENGGSRYSKEVRLLDRKNPKYQGRIFSKDSGIYTHISEETEKGGEGDISHANYVDRLAMLKWSLGSFEPMTNVDKIASTQTYIGEQRRFRVNGNTRNTAVTSKSAGQAAYSSMTVGHRDGYFINAKISQSSFANKNSSRLMSFYSKSAGLDDPQIKVGAINNRLDIDASSVYNYFKENPSHPLADEYMKELSLQPDGKVSIYGDIDSSHIEFYRQLAIRNTLADITDSARENHRAELNFDGIAEACRAHIAAGDRYTSNDGKMIEIDFPLSDNETINELQTIYINSILMNTTEDDIEEKISAAKSKYDEFLQNNLGSVGRLIPDANNPKGVVVDTDYNKITVETIAKYSQYMPGESMNTYYDSIKLLLDHYGSYTPDMLQGDGYKTGVIKNDLIKYNADKALATIRLSDLVPNASDRVNRSDYHLTKEDAELAVRRVNGKLKNEWARQHNTNAESVPDMSVTADMMVHTWRTLLSNGADARSIRVSIDDQGVLNYYGVQYTGKAGENSNESMYNPFWLKGYDGSPDFSMADHISDPAQVKAFSDNYREMRGIIGQIFEPDENGVIDPKYVVDKGKVIVPGYAGVVLNNDPLHLTDMMDRLRLKGYKQMLKQSISEEIHRFAFAPAKEYELFTHGSALNNVYSHNYSTPLERDAYLAMLPKPGETPTAEQNTYMSVIRTLSNKVRLPSVYGDEATTTAQSMRENPHERESKQFDFYYSDLVDGENLRILSDRYKHVFDLNATGTAKTQGTALYLVDGATVSTDPESYGKVIPAENETECPLMKDDLFKHKYCDSADRRIMSFNQMLTALHTPRHVGTAMMNVNGWNFDDGFLVSKRFADANKISTRESNGPRSLMAQDKLSDMHGNKGVISRVVDPNLASDELIKVLDWDKANVSSEPNAITKVFFSEEAQKSGKYKDYPDSFDVVFDMNSDVPRAQQAVEQVQAKLGVAGMDEIMHIFRDNDGSTITNPDGSVTKTDQLDVIMAPYSGMSRFNGGSILDLMENHGTLRLNGESIDGGMGYTNFIVVDMPADVKTHWYKEEDIKDGKGRNASSQFAWALNSKHATAIAGELYGNNMSSVNNLREYSIAIGMDIDKNTAPILGYHPQDGEHRRLFALPEMDPNIELGIAKKASDLDPTYGISITNRESAKKRSSSSISKNAVIKLANKFEMEERVMKDIESAGGFMELPFPLKYSTMANMSDNDKADLIGEYATTPATGRKFTIQSANGQPKEIETYGMPVLSHKLRSGQVFQDESFQAHDYTRHYARISQYAAMYVGISACLNDEAWKKEYSDCIPKMNEQLELCKTKAQSEFDYITNDIVARKFDSKHNLVRDDIMSNAAHHSATAVWSEQCVDQQGCVREFNAKAFRERGMSEEYIDYMRGICAAESKSADGSPDRFKYKDMSMPLDKIALSTEHAEQLGLLDENGKLIKDRPILVWRDPILHDGGIRSLWPTIDDSLMGVAVNPLIDKSFEGDFDGDSVGVCALKTKAAIHEAKTKFSLQANLLQMSEKKYVDAADYPGLLARQDGKPYIHSLYINDGLDIASNSYDNPCLDAERKRLTILANNIAYVERLVDEGKLDESKISFKHGKPNFGLDEDNVAPAGEQNRLYGRSAIGAMKKQCADDLSMWSKGALKGIATDHIIVKDSKTVMESCQHIVEDGAKGNQSKMQSLTDNMGILYDFGPDDKPDLSTLKELNQKLDNGETVRCSKATYEGIQRDVDKATQETTAYKADNTQLGGKIAQSATAALRNSDCEFEATAATSSTTQAILQSKHDPLDAKAKDKIVRFWGNDTWQGYKLTGTFTGTPEEIQKSVHRRIPVNGKDGKDGYVKCTPEEWKTQMYGMYTALKLENVSDDVVNRITDVITDPTTHRVRGMNDMAAECGSLADRIGYGGGKFKAWFDAGVENTKNYMSSDFDEAKLDAIFGETAEKARNNPDGYFNRSQLSNSQVFAPNEYIRMHQTGSDKPLGHKTMTLTQDELANGAVSFEPCTAADTAWHKINASDRSNVNKQAASVTIHREHTQFDTITPKSEPVPAVSIV